MRPPHDPDARRPRTGDVALAVVVLVLELVGILTRTVDESGELSLSQLGNVPAVTYLLLVVGGVAVLWRRGWPLLALVASLSAAVVWDVLGLAGGASLAILVSLYSVGRYVADNATSLLAVAAAAVVAVADDLLVEGEVLSVVAVSVGLVLAAWYLGRQVRARREHLALLEERAKYLERDRAAQARRAVDEERTRIARELHDLVAHRVSMITVQAGAAQTVAASDPARAVRAMGAIETAGREALQELRQILGVLRADEEEAELVPAHGTGDLPGLVSDIRAAGVDVRLVADGLPAALPARVDLAAYRIVQEALTNVLKHGGPTPTAEVRISTDHRAVTIEVTDTGSGGSVLPGSGQGLVGMRERAALLGGTFEAGPCHDGGFRVAARLPLDEGSS
jgi:signal transduction histidine kinase